MIKSYILFIVGILLLLLSALLYIPSFAESYDDWKAPAPRASLKDVSPKEETPKHYLFVNEVVEQENLPYISIKGYNLKIAINPKILSKYNLRSGDLVTSEKMYEIIQADREFQQGILR